MPTATSAHTVDSNNSPWFFISAFWWSMNQAKRIFVWFFPGKYVFPDNPTGDLMRRALAHKSWFDKMSSLWVEQSFWNQFIFIAAVTLVAGVLGLIVGASLLFTLTALFICISGHTLLVSHEHHRIDGAKIMAEECFELQVDLEKCKELLNKVVQTVEPVASTLENETSRIKIQADSLVDEASKLTVQADEFSVQVQDIHHVVKELDTQKDALLNQQGKNLNELNQVNTTVQQAIERIDGIGNAATIYHDMALETRNNHKEFSSAAARFTFFLNQQLIASKEEQLETPYEERYRAHAQFNKETDQFIAHLKESMGF